MMAAPTETQVRKRADQQPAPDHQSLCVRAVIVGVERTLDEAPAGMAEQADRQDHDYDGPERLRQQLFQRALGVGGFAARPDRGEYRQAADDKVDEPARAVAHPREKL